MSLTITLALPKPGYGYVGLTTNSISLPLLNQFQHKIENNG